MSDNIPLEIQMEIMQRLPVNSLLQFRTISKTWKSFIDGKKFLVSYGVRSTQPSHFLVSYELGTGEVVRNYICFVDDNYSFTQVQQFPPSFQHLRYTDMNSLYCTLNVISSSHSIWCFISYKFATLWNPSIRKSVGVVVPYDPSKACIEKIAFGYSVHPKTLDPTIIRISYSESREGLWTVYLFTLISGYWKTLPPTHLPRALIRLKWSSQIAIGCFIYWAAYERIVCADGVSNKTYMIVSFDLNTQIFQLIDLPNSLRVQLPKPVYICKLGESLVIYGLNIGDLNDFFIVWVMEVKRGSITNLKGYLILKPFIV
ncbi:F-box domain containing protein [Tanacetum coccineum]|uniref:F-box domain containing protein n=1 Tax=Tanacetum coccineum TaxID=301880 RepID=A0ABQ4YU88_9ASTR